MTWQSGEGADFVMTGFLVRQSYGKRCLIDTFFTSVAEVLSSFSTSSVPSPNTAFPCKFAPATSRYLPSSSTASMRDRPSEGRAEASQSR